VQLPVQTRFEFIQNGHRRAKDLAGQFLMFHQTGVNHGWPGCHGFSLSPRANCAITALESHLGSLGSSESRKVLRQSGWLWRAGSSKTRFYRRSATSTLPGHWGGQINAIPTPVERGNRLCSKAASCAGG
jgi:hypothetical protein